ncbi:MAG: hypothetical protein AB7I37_12100 [Pirellulales bacterium]
MTTARRRIVRPAAEPPPAHAVQIAKLRQSLAAERVLLGRWVTRLKRAFHSFEKIQGRIARFERRLRNLENNP